MMSTEPFIPHTLEHLTQKRVFPNPLPDVFYDKLLKEYEALEDVTVSRITYPSDGLNVTGLMALPRELRPGGHPLLIYNRGGSREYGKLTLLSAMRSMVPFARQGTIVFASNYRGNDGGEGQEQFGGDDAHDVVNLLHLAQQHTGFDGKNSFMLGHSRGAMMMYLSMRQGIKLQAAIGIAGVADLRGMTQEPLMVNNVFTPLIPHYADTPQKALAERSVLTWPEAITAPLLLMHGDGDKVVPASQSEQLAEALKKAGQACELVIYPEGNHALVRYWDDVILRSSAWMERYRT